MKRKLLLAIVALLCSVGSWATDYTSSLPALGTNWDFTASGPWQGSENKTLEDPKGQCADMSNYKFAEVYYDQTSGTAFEVYKTLEVPNGTYIFQMAAFARRANIWGDDNPNTSVGANGVVFANDATASVTSNTFVYYTVTVTVTNGSLKVGLRANSGNKPNWWGYTDYTLVKVDDESDVDLTKLLVNSSFESGDKTGWTDDTASDGSGAGSDDKIDIFNSDKLSGKDGSYFAERWWYNSNMNIHQTTPTIPEGFYRITAYAKAEAGEIVIYGKAGSNDEKTQAVTTLQDYNVEVFQETAGAIKLGLKGHHVTQTHVAFDNFRLTYLGNPYPALEEAIDDAESKTLGFEVDEYAPYNNVAALTALSSAKAINEAKTATYAEVVAATTALTSATWNVNTELMDAINDGQFANATVLDQTLSENGATVPGWNHSEGIASIRRISTQSKFVGGRAMYFHPGTVSYGQTTGYTMPLKANSVYKFSFQYAGWDDKGTNAPSVSILNENNEGKTLAALPSVASTPAIGPTRYTIYFATDATPGSYTFKYQSPGNTNSTIGDLSLIRVDVLPIEANYVNGTYPAVTLDRTFSAEKWNTLCVPFAFDKSSFAEVRELSGISVNGEHITLELTEAETIVAGKPYLVKAKKNGDGLTATNVILPGEDVQDSNASADGYTVNYVGTYGGRTLNAETAGGNAFVIYDNAIWNVNSEVTVGAYRAYFTVASISGVKALSFDFGDADAINTIANGQQPIANGPIYNLAGQKMSKFQKGVNIVNGKKVIVR